MEKKIRIITHNGKFHVDDLLAVACLQILHGPEHTEVVRSRDPEVWKTGDYVLDVGNVYDHEQKYYDHHQHGGAGTRENGVPYSSLGLIWKHYGKEISGSEEVAARIDKEVVTSVDLADNGIDVYHTTHEGVHPYLIHRILVVFRPTWKEGDVHDERFMELLPIARRAIEREITSARDTIEGERFVEEAYENAEDKRLIIFDGPYPWYHVLGRKPEPLYVVKPKSQGTNWEVECVRNEVHSFQNRKSLPEFWRGYRDEELVRRTGIADAVFCHNAGFIAVAVSKEGAIALARLALQS
jgi:uncharacterized UPF0160 family protein